MSRRTSVCKIGAATALFVTGVSLAFAQSDPRPAQDPMLANGPPVWDANHDGVFTCEEWKKYTDRIFTSADRNRDGYLDPKEFETVRFDVRKPAWRRTSRSLGLTYLLARKHSLK